MTNIDQAFVDQMAQTITEALVGCDLRTAGAAVYGGNVAAGAVTPLIAAAVERAKGEAIRLTLYEVGWWCGECDPAVEQGCCMVPDKVRAALVEGDAS